MIVCVVVTSTNDFKIKAADVIYDSREGRDGVYTYSLWKDYGNTKMTLNGDGKFECSWQDIGNALFREGIKFDCTKTYQQIGSISVEYGVDYQPNGNSYMCVYGWSREPLIEYYIVDSWGSWRPPGADSKGTIEVDGGTYDIYETTRVDQPSIDGNTTFKQYWSVRTTKRTSGTISVTEHFKAWEKLGMKIGKLYEVSMTIEGYQSSGRAEVYANVVSIDEQGTDNNGAKTDNDGKSKEEKSSQGSEQVGKYECETMNKNGRYAGNIYSPFSGAALYANDDSVSTTINFSSDTNDFTLRGASDGADTAKVDLMIGDSTKGTFYFSGSEASDCTIKNVYTGKGEQTVKLVLTSDDGTWDAFLDSLSIKKSADEEQKSSASPRKPVISVSRTESGKIKLTIEKTKNASGYRIYVKKPGSKKYVKLKTVKKNGKKVRSYTFEPSASGDYVFKVKAYSASDGKKTWGSYSKAVKIKIPVT